ncbi:MAG TPA: hypothetical protein VF969_08025 [Burkholderiales bacterium]
MSHANLQAGAGQIVLLASIAIVLAVGYVAIDFYLGSQKDILAVETRGVQIISALSAYKRDSGAYPDSLDKLVPKYVSAVGKCPGGAPIGYVASAGEYGLSCQNVIFKYRAYSYDSRSKSWDG